MSQPLHAARERAAALERQARSAPTTALLWQTLDELSLCVEALSVAEEVLRVQNDALEESRLARQAEQRHCEDQFKCVNDALRAMTPKARARSAPRKQEPKS